MYIHGIEAIFEQRCQSRKKTNIGKILRVAIVAGFSYVAYIVAFTLINNILPLIKNISMAQVYSINTSLLILDGIVIIIAGYIIINVSF